MKTLLTLLATVAILGAADGAALFKKCAACHGANGERHALGKSKIIKDFTSEQIKTALHGYKDGSYGGAMKALMKGQVSTLNDEQIDTLAEYISKK